MADDTMFQEAVDALREGEKAKAKNLLTRLLKTDQNNPQYWIWLSAAVDSTKERIYCLQTALQLDPENATAKRGLVLMGALPPDESIQPFPLNRPRLWEEKLGLASDKPKEKLTIKRVLASPVGRLAGLGVIGIAVLALVVFGLGGANELAHDLPVGEMDRSVAPGQGITFTVSAFPGRNFTGQVIRAQID